MLSYFLVMADVLSVVLKIFQSLTDTKGIIWSAVPSAHHCLTNNFSKRVTNQVNGHGLGIDGIC